jgi:hypothetical protein
MNCDTKVIENHIFLTMIIAAGYWLELYFQNLSWKGKRVMLLLYLEGEAVSTGFTDVPKYRSVVIFEVK